LGFRYGVEEQIMLVMRKLEEIEERQRQSDIVLQWLFAFAIFSFLCVVVILVFGDNIKAFIAL